jgi:predicted MFS family arabinose efflux permease
MRVNNSLKSLFTINAIFVFASQLLGPLFAVYVLDIDGGIMLVSLATSVQLFSSTLFLAIVSKWGIAIKEKEHLLAAGYILRALGWLGYIFVSTPVGLVLLQLVFGLGEALGTPSFNAIFAEHVNKEDDVSMYADYSVISNLVMSLGTLLGGFLVTVWGFNALFLIMSVMATISFLMVLALPKKVL